MEKSVLNLSLALTILVPAAHAGETPGPEIVESHEIQFNAPARHIPTNKMVDAPLLGNGDIGVAVGGNPDALCFYIGKNDFWGIRTQAPMAVGRIQLLAPALKGVPYRARCDMRRACWQGDFAGDRYGLSARAWVDANGNRFFIELTNRGKEPLPVSVGQCRGADAAGSIPTKIVDTRMPLLAGCEQYGGKRWYFIGEMADLKLEAKTMTDVEIARLARSERGTVRPYDGKTANTLTAPSLSDAITVSGWIRIKDFNPTEANYIVSKGAWNRACSLGLSAGKLRFAINGTFLQSDTPLPKDKWLHVAAVYDGKMMAIYLNGKKLKQIGGTPFSGDMAFLYDPDAGRPNARKVAVVTRIVGRSADTDGIVLKPGENAALVSVIQTDLDTRDPLADSLSQAESFTAEKVAECAQAHQAWWERFWSKSFVEIPDKVIEQHWYATQYIMASCSRAGKVAPGLWGCWITSDHTAWHGDFHLNYNFQAPFYNVYSANHPDLSLPFYDAMVQSVPRGKTIAAAHGFKGILLPVSIGPWGMCPEGNNCLWGQRSNAAYAALNFIWYYQYTQDTEWLRKTGYPYLREVEKFWTDYLKLENGPDGKPRYVIEHDAIHEGSSGARRSGVSADFNPILSLGLVHTLYANMLTMSENLGLDEALRPKWRDILAKLSRYPTQERDGKTVFRYTERGMAWYNSNTLGIQHIFPACAIGLDSDPKLLEISRNMIDAMSRWRDNNGASSWYTACAHVGYDPERSLKEMRHMYDTHSMPNKILYFGGGGIENASPSLAVNEMLLQSYEGVIRFFPCWPKKLDARFGTLRARGAFLVSAELKNGVIGGVKILSEKGKDLTVQNPWPGTKVHVMRNAKAAETVEGNRFTLKTAVNETLELKPGKVG